MILCFSVIIMVKVYSIAGRRECIPTIEPSSRDVTPAIIEAEHSYSSVTNGNPYSKDPVSVGSVRLDETTKSGVIAVKVSRSYVQNVTFAYNETHVCSSAQLQLETDICSAGYIGACDNKTSTCDSVCFSATDFYSRHTLRLFKSLTKSFSLGRWTMSDYVDIYTVPNKEVECFYSSTSYRRWSHNTGPYENLQKMKCPVGERCRITIGKYMLSDPITTFVGCEKDGNQYNGCEEGCKWRKYHRSPDGERVNWANMCRYCCHEDLCNDPYKCKGLQCDFTPTVPPDVNIAYQTSRNTIVQVFCSLTVILVYYVIM